MQRFLPALLLICFSLPAFAQGPGSPPDIRIQDTDPPSGALLDAREPLYLRIAYASAIPLRFQAAAYRGGVPVERAASFNPAPLYPAGSGEAVAWVAFDGATAIDEVRVRVMDRDWQPVTGVSQTIDLRWSDVMPEYWRTPAAWAKRLSDAQQDMVRRAAQEHAAGQSGGWGNVLVMLMGLSLPAYLILQVWLWRSSHGGWRRAALAPLLLMVPLLLYTVFAFLADSNLWPLVLLFLSPLACLYLLLLWIARRLFASGA